MNPLTICLPTDDRARAAAFYRDAFDLAFVGEIEDDGLPEPLQFRLNEQTLLMFIPRDGFEYTLVGAKSADGSRHSSFLSLSAADEAEVDRQFSRAIDASATEVDKPNRRPWGYIAIVADPDGHLWLIRAD